MQKETLTAHNEPVEHLAAIKRNDEAVLKALYKENYYKIESYVLNNSGSVEEAKDIYQEAFIAVWRNIQLDKFTPVHGSSLSGYIYQVAKNKWTDHLRSGHFKKVIPLNDSAKSLAAEEELTDNEHNHLLAIRQNFAKLGDNCRELLKRFYYSRESLKTIAKAFEWTEATAKNNKYRCLQRLRELVKNK